MSSQSCYCRLNASYQSIAFSLKCLIVGCSLSLHHFALFAQYFFQHIYSALSSAGQRVRPVSLFTKCVSLQHTEHSAIKGDMSGGCANATEGAKGSRGQCTSGTENSRTSSCEISFTKVSPSLSPLHFIMSPNQMCLADCYDSTTAPIPVFSLPPVAHTISFLDIFPIVQAVWLGLKGFQAALGRKPSSYHKTLMFLKNKIRVIEEKLSTPGW